MKAVQIEKYGPAESLAIVDVDMPVPGPDDVIIRVYATGVNRLDLLLREGSVFQVPLPRIPGTDFAGEIVEVGINVEMATSRERAAANSFCSRFGGTRSIWTNCSQSDVVTAQVPYSETTHHLTGAPQLARVTPSAVLINTARGGVVDDAALADALCERRVGS